MLDRIVLLLLVIRFTKCRIGLTVDLPFVNPKRSICLGSLNISLARINLSMIFSIVGRRAISLWPLPPGLGIGTTIEIFQNLGIRPTLQCVSNACSVKGVPVSPCSHFVRYIDCSLSGCCFSRVD